MLQREKKITCPILISGVYSFSNPITEKIVMALFNKMDSRREVKFTSSA